MKRLTLLSKVLCVINLSILTIVIINLISFDKKFYLMFLISLFICYINFSIQIILLLKRKIKILPYFFVSVILLIFYWCDFFKLVTLISE